MERTLNAHAKVNLGLDVLRKRSDGYHELRMIMQSLKLCDRITLREVPGTGIKVTADLNCLPTDEHNLAYRAAKLLMEEFGIVSGVEIHLEKHIPMAAGLAGGSSDAAAVLRGINDLFELGLTREQLMLRGVKIGADVPYCILGGTALAEGIGEVLTPLPPVPEAFVVLAKPPVDVSTAYVYGNLKADQLQAHPDIDGQIEAIRAGDFRKISSLMGNVLETVTIPAHPVIEDLKNIMKDAGAANAMMSGSGPTVFGLFEAESSALQAKERLQAGGLTREVFLTGFYNILEEKW